MMEIKLYSRKYKGQVSIVDDEDYSLLIKYRWNVCKVNNRLYAVSRIDGKRIAMHRLLLSAPVGVEVDHKNHGTLDNRRFNLRLASRAQQRMNSLKSLGSSRFKGVSLHRPGIWQVVMRFNGCNVYVGHFNNEVDAAMAYDCKAVELFGEFALLNFPVEGGFFLNGENL